MNEVPEENAREVILARLKLIRTEMLQANTMHKQVAVRRKINSFFSDPQNSIRLDEAANLLGIPYQLHKRDCIILMIFKILSRIS